MNPPPYLPEESIVRDGSRLTAQMARAIFEERQKSVAVISKSGSDGDDSTMMPGTFNVDWNSSVWSSDDRAESVESEILASRHFMACNGESTVEAHQRLLTFMDEGDTIPRFYIATIIPSSEFYSLHPSDFADHFIQCDRESRDFSGIVIYHTLSGMFCEIASFDQGQINIIYNAQEDYDIGDYQHMQESVRFVLGDFHLHLNQSATTRCEGISGCVGACVEPVIVTVCAVCRARVYDGQWCGCRRDGPVTRPINWVSHYELKDTGGGGSPDFKDKEKEDKPCNDKKNNKANPLAKMQLPNGWNPKGFTFGTNVRQNEDGSKKGHYGVDFYAPVGTSVYAVGYGQIIRIVSNQVNRIRKGNGYVYPAGYKGNRDKSGNLIHIRRYDGSIDAYWHLQAGCPIATNPRTGQPFAQGDWVYVGDMIGYTGITGNASPPTLPHLHFGTKDRNGNWVDPFEKGLNAILNIDGLKRSVSTPCE